MLFGDDLRRMVNTSLADQFNIYLTLRSIGVFGDILQPLCEAGRTFAGSRVQPRPGVSVDELKGAHDILRIFLSSIRQSKLSFTGMEDTPERISRFTPEHRSLIDHFAEIKHYGRERMVIDQFLLLINTLERSFSMILHDSGDPNPKAGTLGQKWSKVRRVASSVPWTSNSQLITDVSELNRRRTLAVHHECFYEPREYPMAELGSASCWSLPGQLQPSGPGAQLVMDSSYLEYAMRTVADFADVVP